MVTLLENFVKICEAHWLVCDDSDLIHIIRAYDQPKLSQLTLTPSNLLLSGVPTNKMQLKLAALLFTFHNLMLSMYRDTALCNLSTP